MKSNYLGTQYAHKFANATETKYVGCSEEEFTALKSKPELEGFEYQYSIKDMLKVDSPSSFLEEGYYTIVDDKKILKNWEDNGEVKFEYE